MMQMCRPACIVKVRAGRFYASHGVHGGLTEFIFSIVL